MPAVSRCQPSTPAPSSWRQRAISANVAAPSYACPRRIRMNIAPPPQVDERLSLSGAPRRLNSPGLLPGLAAHAQADHAQGDGEGDRDQGQQAVDGLEGGVVGGVAED